MPSTACPKRREGTKARCIRHFGRTIRAHPTPPPVRDANVFDGGAGVHHGEKGGGERGSEGGREKLVEPLLCVE